MEFINVFGGVIVELCFVKVVCYNDCVVEIGEKFEFFSISFYVNSKFGRDGGGLGLIEVLDGEGNSSKEG